MVYILNKFISPKKTIGNALTNIYGIGPKRAKAVCAAIGVSTNTRTHQLTTLAVHSITTYISNNYVVSAALRRVVHTNIQNLIKIHCYKGFRHQNHLPVRGQRTHTNAQTRKRHAA